MAGSTVKEDKAAVLCLWCTRGAIQQQGDSGGCASGLRRRPVYSTFSTHCHASRASTRLALISSTAVPASDTCNWQQVGRSLPRLAVVIVGFSSAAIEQGATRD